MGAFGWSQPPPRGSSHPSFVPPRKYAPVCGACKLPIIPSEDQDTYKIECLGRSFHESCYRCEVQPRGTEGGQNTSGAVLVPPQSTRGWCWTRGGFGEKAGRNGAASCMRCSAGLSCSLCTPLLLRRAVGHPCHQSRRRMGATPWASTSSASPATSAGGTSRPAKKTPLVPRWTRRERRDQRFITTTCRDPVPQPSSQPLIANRKSPGRAAVVGELRFPLLFYIYKKKKTSEAGLVSLVFFFLLELPWGFI